jgi:hypothetical protein
MFKPFYDLFAVFAFSVVLKSVAVATKALLGKGNCVETVRLATFDTPFGAS